MSDTAVRCEVCRSLIDEEDLFCPNCGTEAPLRDGQTARTQPGTQLSTNNFECTGCGASMSYDAGARALRCPFCGATQMKAKPNHRIVAPKRVVPFRLNRDQAMQVMRTTLMRGFFRPSDLTEKAVVVNMVPVYAAYWRFRAKTHTYWTADTSDVPPSARGDWRPLFGEHYGEHETVLVGAGQALSPRETSAICPFDLSDAVAPDEVDMENITVEQVTLPRNFTGPLARSVIEAEERRQIEMLYVPGRARNVHVNMLISGMEGEPILLPVWILAYRYRDRLYRVLINGQTGRINGEAPFSYLKLAAVTAAAVVGAILVFLLFAAMTGL